MYYFGERLRKLRKSRNLTQKQLAGLIRSTDSIISAYENGFRTPTLDNLISISAVFHVTTDYLLGKERHTIDVSGLDDSQIAVVQSVVDALRTANDRKERR